MVWTNPRTWLAGEKPTAATLNAHIRDNLKAIGDPWTSYTPTLAGITLGNGTLDCRYMQAGKLVFGRVRFIAGSTTTYSATNLRFSPPAAYGAAYDPSADILGHGNVNNNTSASRTTIEVMPFADGTFVLAYTGALVTNTAPFTFGTASRIGFAFHYEAA